MTTLISTRIDKWLWAARFFKTRALAVKALKSSHIKLVDEDKRKSLKPAFEVKVGQVIEIQKGAFNFSITVSGIVDKRGSAAIAATLYKESPESIKKREEIKSNLRAQPKNPFGGSKPDKHTVRKNRAIKRGF